MKYKDKEWLLEQYAVMGRTLKDMADELGVAVSTIQVWVKKFNIKKPRGTLYSYTYFEINCSECDNPFSINLRYYDRRIREGQSSFYCSRKCVSKMVSRHKLKVNVFKGLSGELNYAWKGGVTGVNEYLRDQTREWKRKILHESGFKCFITGNESHKLHAHHITPFHELRDTALKELGLTLKVQINEYTDKELNDMKRKIIELHENEKGYALDRDIHMLFHKLYGDKTSESDLLEFKTRYRLREFDEILAKREAV